MKKMNKAISAVLAAAMAVGTLAANAATMTASAAVDTSNYSQQDFYRNWSYLINQEKAKYPETKDGKQCYWNGYNEDGYTTSPCGHGWDGSGAGCLFITPPNNFYNSSTYAIIDERDGHNQGMKYGQCAGFAAKVQGDIFQTGAIIRLQTDRSGHYTALNNKKVKYDFKPGDAVRFSGHSIFITDVNGETITFAQCNADSHCGIDWDATSYKGKTITASYLKSVVDYIDRPMLTGDLNLDGGITTDDAEIFKNTVMKNGITVGPAAAYDKDFNGYIDENDYNAIKYMTSNTHANTKYVTTRLRTVTSRWKSVYPATSSEAGKVRFMTADGNVYCNTFSTTSGVCFYGNYDKNTKKVTVPSKVTDPSTGIQYNVTEVGFYGNRGPATYFMEDIEELTLPTSVQKITPYAFYRCPLKKITIPNETVLAEIGEYAFYDCNQLTNITLPHNLATVNKYAFCDCDALSNVYFDDDASFNCKLHLIDDGAFTKCPNLREVTISNNLQRAIYLGTRNNSTCSVFDANKNITLRLPNGNSVAGYLYFNNTNDYAKFNNGSLIVYAGNYKFFDPSGMMFKTHPSVGIGRVYPG